MLKGFEEGVKKMCVLLTMRARWARQDAEHQAKMNSPKWKADQEYLEKYEREEYLRTGYTRDQWVLRKGHMILKEGRPVKPLGRPRKEV